MEFEGAIAAPSTAQSSFESAASLGRKSSGSGGNDDLNVTTLGPIGEILDKSGRTLSINLRPIAAPAASSGTERGRQERKERSDRSSLSKPSSIPVMIKAITKSPMSVRSSDRKSKSPRSNRGSARESTPGRYGRDPEVALEQLIAETGEGSRPDSLLINDGRLCRIDSNDAEPSDVVDTVNLRINRGRRDSSQHRGEDDENMVDIGETEEQQDVAKRAKAGCPECIEREKQKVLDNAPIEELQNRLVLAGNQAIHLIDNARLLERHLGERA